MIRKAKKEDSLNLAALSIQVWLHTYAPDGIRRGISEFALGTFTEQYFKDLLKNPDYRILVFIKENHLIGYAMANLKSLWQDQSNGYEIDKLYVQEHFQGKGIGRCLISEMAALHGGSFWLSTWYHNWNAINFYKHMGFVDIGHRYFELEGELHENRVFAFNTT
jgi:ribosomal protein S18 acetylase RimI-like enzyme